jgi:hypothetical protein
MNDVITTLRQASAALNNILFSVHHKLMPSTSGTITPTKQF